MKNQFTNSLTIPSSLAPAPAPAPQAAAAALMPAKATTGTTGTTGTSLPDSGAYHARLSAYPIQDVLKTRMLELGLSNRDLQTALGYPNANVIAMMRNGTMRLPAAKAVDAAKLLQLDPVFLLGKAIAESDPQLWKTVSETLGDKLITEKEYELILFLRKKLNGYEMNLLESPKFIQAFTSLLDDLSEDEEAKKQALLGLADTEAKRRSQ